MLKYTRRIGEVRRKCIVCELTTYDGLQQRARYCGRDASSCFIILCPGENLRCDTCLTLFDICHFIVRGRNLKFLLFVMKTHVTKNIGFCLDVVEQSWWPAAVHTNAVIIDRDAGQV